MLDSLRGLKGSHFWFRGRPCVFMGIAPNGRAIFMSGDGWILEVPDPETGMPVWPTVEMVLRLMAAEALILRADPLNDLVRQRARRAEPTRQELVEAKQKTDPDRTRDRWYMLREEALSIWDRVGQCALSERGITEWWRKHFDVAELAERFGRVPSASTFRTWVRTRGRPNDRRPADFASMSNIVPRRRRIDPVVLAIIKHHALTFHSKPKQSISTYFRKAADDVLRYRRGENLEIFDFERGLEKPEGEVRMCTRRIFTIEVERAKSAAGFAVAYGTQARRQRFGGGGVAQEPTRFLEIVQLDDTPFPMVFIIDPVRRVPVGVPTVTIALDVYTRAIVGWDISYDVPSHATYMRTLLSTGLPKDVPESFRNISELAEICGRVVGYFLVDNAKHQVARAAQDAGGDIGFGVRWAGAKQPTHKPHVESCLGTLQDIVREMLPAGTWDIPLMREFGYDPSKHAVATLEHFRILFAEAVAKYHTRNHTELGNRPPLDVWREQRQEHGLDWVHDVDHFRRAIGNVSYASFRGDGAVIEGLRYGSNGTDDAYPYSNEDILHHLALARGQSSPTKKQTFADVKIKWDPNDLSKAWLFDEHLREYVPIPCTRRRYADGLPLWLHDRLKDFAKKRALAFEEEFDMLKVREEFTKTYARVLPEAAMADRRAAARLIESEEGRNYLGNSAEVLRIASSPSGMENKLSHDTRVASRRDANRIAPRSSGRSRSKGDRHDTRDASRNEAPSPQQHQVADDDAYVGRRLDSGWSDGGYQ